MGRRTITALATAVALGATAAVVVTGVGGDQRPGAGSSLAPSILGAPDGSVLAAGLVTPTSCDDLGATMAALVAEHGGPMGRMGLLADDAVDEMAETTDAGAGDGTAPAAGDTGASATEEFAAGDDADVGGDTDGTNVQEAGVDEPDIVERVGDLVVVGTQGHLRVVTVDTAGAPVQRGELVLGPWSELELMAAGPERVVALLRDGGATPVRGVDDSGQPSPIQPAWNTTTVVLIDLADADAPTELSRVDLEGWLVDARAVDGVVRLAVRNDGPQVDVHSMGEFTADATMDWDDADEDDYRRYEEEFQAEYEQRVRQAMAEVEGSHWQPHARLTAADGTTAVEPVVPCDRIAFPTSFAGTGTLTIAAIDVTGDTLVIDDATSVVTAGENLYSTTDRVVVATTRWEPCCSDGPVAEEPPPPDVEPFFEEDDEGAAGATAIAATLPMIEPGWWPGGRGGTTDLHVFDVEGTVVSHVGSGSVEGTLLNQFSMSIHDGVLRTATTDWDDEQARTESLVTTFRVEGADLVRLGQVGGLGPNEDIQAVRFMGEVAYVVTFRRTDPLYVVDLSDPTEPRTRGELKIEGYSAYLHPIGPGRLLGVGQDADPETGITRGVQVSTFDVTDPTAPTRIDVDVTPDATSEVEWDHHALTVGPDGTVFVPFEQWSDTGERLGVLVYEVGDDGVLTAVGTLNAGSRWELRPRRTLVLDTVLLTVGEGGIITWDRDSFATIGTLRFPEPDWERLEQEMLEDSGGDGDAEDLG